MRLLAIAMIAAAMAPPASADRIADALARATGAISSTGSVAQIPLGIHLVNPGW